MASLVTTSKIVAYGGWEELQKLVVIVVASTLRLATLVGGHEKASRVEEKLAVMRRRMVVSLGATPNCGERVVVAERVVAVERESCRCGERERERERDLRLLPTMMCRLHGRC